MAESPKFSRLNGNRGRENDGDVRFQTGSGNTAGSRMRNASDHNYWNSSFIMDVAMGQIPRSTPQNAFLVNLTYFTAVKNFENQLRFEELLSQ